MTLSGTVKPTALKAVVGVGKRPFRGILLFATAILLCVADPHAGQARPDSSWSDLIRARSGSDATEMDAVLAEAFNDISDYYIDPVSLQTLTLAGLEKLDPTPNELKAEAIEESIVLELKGAEIARAPEPKPGDVQGWAELVTHIASRARQKLPFLAHVGSDEIYTRLFAGFIQHLDRFTRYAPPSQADDQRAQRDGFGGIGIVLDYGDGLPRVTEVLPNSPAAKGGLKADDRLVTIDGRSMSGIAAGQIPNALRGEIGSRVVLQIQREDRATPLMVALVRALVVPPSVTSSTAPGGVAVFKVSLFNHDTGISLADAIDQAQHSMGTGLRGALLDLRDNPGGLLDQGVDVASLFLDGGPVIATTGRHPKSLQNFSAGARDRLHGLPMAVLVNGGSASAAEIVAAALQDRGRAIVVGTSSYGKGTVQMVLTLPNGAELTLTWARMMTPGGYILHEHGVVPAFCTAAETVASDQDETSSASAALISAVIDQPQPALAKTARSRLTNADWAQLRATCPPTSENSDLDIDVADQLILDSRRYNSALIVPGVAIAGSAHRSAIGKRLQ